MHLLAHGGQVVGVVAILGTFLVGLQDVEGERCGEGGEGRAGSRVGRSEEAHDEQNADDERQDVARCHGGEQVVATLVYAHLGGKHVEEHAEH